MYNIITVVTLLLLSVCFLGCGPDSSKIPHETDDYVMECGCFGGYGNQPDLVSQLESIGAFGFHELEASPYLPKPLLELLGFRFELDLFFCG